MYTTMPTIGGGILFCAYLTIGKVINYRSDLFPLPKRRMSSKYRHFDRIDGSVRVCAELELGITDDIRTNRERTY